jgi:hypothetical protein
MEKNAVKDGIYSLLDSSKSVAYNASLIFLRYGIGGVEMIFRKGAVTDMEKVIGNVLEYEKQSGFDGEKFERVLNPLPVPLKKTKMNNRAVLIFTGLYSELRNGEKEVVDSYFSKLIKRKGLTREDVL